MSLKSDTAFIYSEPYHRKKWYGLRRVPNGLGLWRQWCEVATVVMETAQLVLSQFKNLNVVN